MLYCLPCGNWAIHCKHLMLASSREFRFLRRRSRRDVVGGRGFSSWFWNASDILFTLSAWQPLACLGVAVQWCLPQSNSSHPHGLPTGLHNAMVPCRWVLPAPGRLASTGPACILEWCLLFACQLQFPGLSFSPLPHGRCFLRVSQLWFLAS